MWSGSVSIHLRSTKRAVVLRTFAIAVLTVASLGTAWGGDIVFDSFGPGDTYSQFGYAFGIAVGSEPLAIAVPFSPSFASHLDRISLPLQGFVPAHFGTRITVWSDSNGLPDAVLEEFVFPLGGPLGTYEFSSTVNPALLPGSTYWVSIELGSPDPGEFGFWRFVPSPASPLVAERFNSGAWTSREYIPGALRVTALEDAPQVPEPGSMLLASVGLLLTCLRFRHSR
jgi:hypothetical protein